MAERDWVSRCFEGQFPDSHSQDGRRRCQTQSPRCSRGSNGFREIAASVAEKAGAQHFHGVTVQPMVQMDGSYELIVGSSIDAQFGPVLLFGLGGQLVEVFKDHALALPPLNTTLARRFMEQTQIFKALQGVRAASR